MKNLLIFSVCFLISNALSSQTLGNLYSIEFRKKGDYKTYEPAVLQCANYVLERPLDGDDIDHQFAFRLILQWMEGTPDHTFMLDEEFVNLTKGDSDLLGLYFAALVKAAVGSEETLDDKTLKATANKIYLDYCSKKENKVKANKTIKQMLKDRK